MDERIPAAIQPVTPPELGRQAGRPAGELLSAPAGRLLCFLILATAAGGLASGCTGRGPDGPPAAMTPTPPPRPDLTVSMQRRNRVNPTIIRLE